LHYRLLQQGSLLEEGDATVSVKGDLIFVKPVQNQPIPIKASDISRIEEFEPYGIVIALKDGTELQVSQMGNLRTQILSQINKLKMDNARESFMLVGIGTPAKFTGLVNQTKATLYLYDDALVIMSPISDPVQHLFSFIDTIEVDTSGYNIKIILHDNNTIELSQFGQMTQSLIKNLNDKISNVKVRTFFFFKRVATGAFSY